MGQYYFPILNTHASLWLIAIIFFILSLVYMKKENEKLAKIFQMILRLFFVLLIVTGGSLVYIHGFHWATVVKGILALWFIGIMEIIVTKRMKNELNSSLAKIYWVQFTVSFVLVLYFGYIVI